MTGVVHMTKRTKGLLAVSILLVALMALVAATSNLRANIAAVRVQAASERQAEFDEVMTSALLGDFGDAQYRVPTSTNAADYAFVTYEIALSSFCPLPADWAIVNLTPAEGDVALIRGEAQTVPPFGGRTVTATLLTSAEAAQAERKVWAEYYVFGRFLTANTQGGAAN